MDKIYIKVDRKTGMVYLDNTVIGRDNENLQQELIFSFENGFILGSPRLEYKIVNNKYHIPMEIDGENYKIPVKNILTKEGRVEMQLVVVQIAQNEEIPIFKSNVFYMYCNKSINAQEEAPDDYEYWLDVLEEKIVEIDEALTEVDNLDIDANKVGKITTVEITRKDGTTKSVQINDGENGADGISLEYNWSGTNLGIKREDEQNYQYVNLKGDKGDAGSIKIEIVNELPQIGDEETIYLVPYQEAETGNIYKEYIYINNTWEELGSIPVEVDLSDYYTKSEVNALIPDELSDLADDSTHRLVTDTEKTTWNNKLDSSALTNYVKFTDYATGSKGGTVRSGGFGVNVNSSGQMFGVIHSYAQYNSDDGTQVISKGTLENVITGKDLTTKSYVDGLVGDIATALDTIQGEVI